jgi:hypothetical protein
MRILPSRPWLDRPVPADVFPDRVSVPRWVAAVVSVTLVFGGAAFWAFRDAGQSGHPGVAGNIQLSGATGSQQTLASLPVETRQAIVEALRQARPVDGTDIVTFTNPEQHLTARIGPTDVHVFGEADAAVVFRAPRLGRGPDLVPLTSAAPNGTGTSRVTLMRRAGATTVTEWWANDTDGLEQGFVVDTRPAGTGSLEVRQTVVTSLVATRSDRGDAVVFSDDTGERLRFGQPAAWDADGRTLPMRLTLEGETLGFVVDDERATYPVTIDPTWTQQAYLQPTTHDQFAWFGRSVAVAGAWMVIGEPGNDSGATGVNGDPANSSANDAGAAYIFMRDGVGGWRQRAFLKASNTKPGAAFGTSVAVAGNTIVVGAPGEESAATGVNGDQTDSGVRSAGAVYVFVMSGPTIAQQAYLKASNTDQDDEFGTSVAIAGDTLVVGAPNEASAATGVNSNQADNSAFGAGAAYVFERSGATWAQQAYLKPSNTHGGDRFASALAIAGDTVVVGAWGESSAATGVNGNQADQSAIGAGAAYVFVRSGTTWTQQAYLKASNAQAADWFGYAVAIADGTIVVGAPRERSAASGVNGDQEDNSSHSSGAVYVFARNGTMWTQQAYLKASNPGQADFFGHAVAIALNTVIVGSPGESSAATGVNGNQTDDTATAAGAAYVFRRLGTDWTQQEYLKASDAQLNDSFGWSLAVDRNSAEVIVGALWRSVAYRYTVPVPGDFEGDFYPDLLFQHTSGAIFLWRLFPSFDSVGPAFSNGYWLPASSLSVSAVGDLTGDGRPDLVLRSSSDPTLAIWQVQGQAKTAEWVTHVNPHWSPVAIADVNVDGRNDLVWQGADGRVVVWFMSVSSTGAPELLGAGFVIDTGALTNTQQPLALTAAQRVAAVVTDPLAAGLNLLVQDTTTGDLLTVFVQPDLNAPSQRFGLPARTNPSWQIRATADYNGDGQTDLLFQHVATGDLYVWHIVNNVFTSGAYVNPARVDANWRVVGP